jgi:ferredoxin-NADP reductase
MRADRYYLLRVKRLLGETDDAASIVFDVPAVLGERFAYRPGQFVTLRVVIDGQAEYRSYSMSSAPLIDDDLQVTVKRVPGGVVSNWLIDHLREGDQIEVSIPAGDFVLDEGGGDVLAFAGGSGVTPVFSIIKAATRTTDRRVRLLFANRDRSAAIFGDQLADLAARYAPRLTVEHHEDVVDGFLDADDVASFAGDRRDASCYVCGPAPFMEIVETGLRRAGVADAHIHVERFTPADQDDEPVDDEGPDDSPIRVTITVGREKKTLDHRGRSTILQTARFGGLRVPSSCEAGHCATCMARVLEGEVQLITNDVLTPEELDEGWVLTCQAVPVTPVVRVVYE